MNAESIPRVGPRDIDTARTPTLDVRSRPGKEQIRGALRYDPKALLGAETLALPLPHEQQIVVYGDSDDEAAQVAAQLIAQGYEKAAILEGGFDAYKAANFPTEDVTQEQPVPGDESSGIKRA